jgi:hypothetical protein
LKQVALAVLTYRCLLVQKSLQTELRLTASSAESDRRRRCAERNERNKEHVYAEIGVSGERSVPLVQEQLRPNGQCLLAQQVQGLPLGSTNSNRTSKMGSVAHRAGDTVSVLS